MIPAGPHPLMMCGDGDPLDELGKIPRSLRVRASAQGYFERLTVAPSSATKRAFIFWIKPGQVGGSQALYTCSSTNVVSANRFGIRWDGTSDQRLDVYQWNGSGYDFRLTTARSFRDIGGHLMVGVFIDTTQASPADRVKIKVGADAFETAFTNNAQPAQNFVPYWGAANRLERWGWHVNDGAPDCYFSNVVSIDGGAPASTDVGLTHPRTSQWRPKSKGSIKSVVDAAGAASYFLPFDDPTSTATICADASSHGNSFTAVNISVSGVTTDSLFDTPTDNYCTLNPLATVPGVAQIPIAVANMYCGSSTVGDKMTVSTPLQPGRWQAEGTVVYLDSGIASFGLLRASDLGGGTHYFSNGQIYKNGALVSTVAGYGANDVIGIDVNTVTKEVLFYKNGVLVYTATGVDGTEVFRFYTSFGCGWSFNCGQRPFAYPISGPKAIGTKNLPIKPAGPMRVSDAYVAVTNSGANIAAALATARAGWPSYIELFKRRDAIEGWRWRFSDDSAYYLDSATTAGKAAFPALAGASYIGHALKVSATNGIATGRLVHVNGVADTVSDGLSTSKKMILLKNEATGSWFWYHPFLTAGKLLYLDDALVGETTDNTINTVTASGFSVAAALASGTYRWVVLADTPGFLSLGGYVTNGVAEGPFMNAGLLPMLAFFRLKSSGDLPILDATRNPANLANSVLYLDGGEAETSAATFNVVDLISCGIKSRVATSAPEDINYLTGREAIYVAVGQPFRYANAR